MPNRVNIADPVAKVQHQEPSKFKTWKFPFLVAVILLSIGWIAFFVIRGDTTKVDATQGMVTAGTIMTAIGDREDLLSHISVKVEGEPPNETVTVKGYVTTQALLDELKSIVTGAAGDKPVDFAVTVRK